MNSNPNIGKIISEIQTLRDITIKAMKNYEDASDDEGMMMYDDLRTRANAYQQCIEIILDEINREA